MSRWPLRPLGEIISHRKAIIRIDDADTYKRCRVQLAARGIVLRDRVLGSDIKTKEQQVCEAGDFLVAEIDAKMGGYGIVPDDLAAAIVSSHYFLYSINEKKLNRDFLGWYIKRPAFLAQISAKGSTNYSAIRPHHVLEYEIPLPSLAEQQRIVSHLDAVADRSDRVQRLIREIGVDLLQASRSIIWRSSENGARSIPCREFMKRRRCDVSVEPETAYAFAGVYSFGRGVFRSGTKLGSEFSYRELTRLHTDNFVYPKLMAWEGALGVVPPECDGRVVSPEFPVFEIDKAIIDPVVIDTFFRDPRVWPRLQSGSTGTNLRRKRISPDQLLAMEIPIPGKADQDRLVALDALRREVVQRSAVSRQELESLVPSLLDHIFNGTVTDESIEPETLRATA